MQIFFKAKWNSKACLAVLIAISLLSTSCKNLFSELARQDADAAVYYAAKRFADTRQYDSAINKMYELSDGYYNRREVQVFLASVFAGKCGLDFLVFAKSVINNPTLATPIELALVHMKNVNSEADCETAEALMRAVSPARDGIMSDSKDDAVYMAFISLAKIGAVLSRIADTTANTDNDGIPDVAFNACAIAADDARKIASGLTLLYNNLAMTTSSFASKMGAMTTICGVAGATCSKTDPSTFTAPELEFIRGVVDYDQFGLGADSVYPSCP